MRICFPDKLSTRMVAFVLTRLPKQADKRVLYKRQAQGTVRVVSVVQPCFTLAGLNDLVLFVYSIPVFRVVAVVDSV